MKVYFSALIDKSVSAENSKLSKKLQRTLKKNLKIPNSSLNSNIHNAFIFLGAEKPLQKNFDVKTAENLEAMVSQRLSEYYLNNKSNLKNI